MIFVQLQVADISNVYCMSFYVILFGLRVDLMHMSCHIAHTTTHFTFAYVVCSINIAKCMYSFCLLFYISLKYPYF